MAHKSHFATALFQGSLQMHSTFFLLANRWTGGSGMPNIFEVHRKFLLMRKEMCAKTLCTKWNNDYQTKYIQLATKGMLTKLCTDFIVSVLAGKIGKFPNKLVRSVVHVLKLVSFLWQFLEWSETICGVI